MSASSLRELNELRFYVSGNVTVHPDASIASNVLLQADPNSHLIIGERVAIGPGAILHATQGTLEIGSDVTIGTEVLIIGAGVIGDGACIGAFSTILSQIKVDKQAIIAPRSLIGDESRVVNLDDGENAESAQSSDDSASTTEAELNSQSSSDSETEPKTKPEPATKLVQTRLVYGKASVEKLIQVMFPARDYDMNNGGDSKEDA